MADLVNQQPVEIMLTRLEGKIDVITERVANQGAASGETARQLQRGLDEVKTAVQQAREEARHDSSAVRVALEGQIEAVNLDLEAHIHALNPHSEQEQWLRERLKDLAKEIGSVRAVVSESTGASRAMRWVMGVCIGAGVGVASVGVQLFIYWKG